MIFPVRVSITLDCSHPPKALSNKLPRPPHKVTARSQRLFSDHPQPVPPWSPGVEKDSAGQNGRRMTVVRAIRKAPRKPAIVPNRVIPPLVPGGTWRKLMEVNSLGLVLDRIPSSEEKVSAATAA